MISREWWSNLNMTASIDTVRRGVYDPLASTVDCVYGPNWYIVFLSVYIENWYTLNHGLTSRLDANSSNLPHFEHH